MCAGAAVLAEAGVRLRPERLRTGSRQMDGGAGELRRRSAALCECGQLGTRRCVDVSWTVEIVINVYSDMRAATAQRALSRRRRRLVRPCRASRQMPPGATITDTLYPAPPGGVAREPSAVSPRVTAARRGVTCCGVSPADVTTDS